MRGYCRLLVVACASLLIQAAPGSGADANKAGGPDRAKPEELEKLTVADVLKGLSLDESKLDYIDEPPGKLRALESEATPWGKKAKVRVRIEVDYTAALFSEKRKWDPKAVRAATVRKVTVTPVGAEK
jgi:hypothetical protein